MIKNLKRIIVCILTVCMCLLLQMNSINVDAAETASISIGSASGNVGDTVTVTVSVSAPSEVYLCDFYINYDASILEAVSGYDAGGGGTIRLLSTDKTSFSIKFKINNPGSSAISVVTSTAIVSSAYEDRLVISSSSGTVTGKAPVSYSSDNTLSSLQISPGTLSPAFSPEITTYNASVDSDVEELVVSAVANDSNAKVSVSGRKMDPGRNTTTITVTAEDGSVKKYIIYTTRAAGSNEQETQTEAETQTEVQTEQTDNIQVTIDKVQYTVIQDYSEHELPEGYEETEIDYNGGKIIAGKGLKTGLILMYLESDNGEGGFYVYDETAKTFSPYNTVDEPQVTFVVLPIPDSVNKPDGYTLTRFTMNGKEVDVLIDADRQYCLFYGVSSSGEKGWFSYRISDATIQAYSIDKSDISGIINTSGKDTKPANNKGYIVVISILAVLIAAFAVVTGILCSKLSKVKKVFNMASKDGVDLDSYTEKEIDEYDLDDYEEDGDYDDLDSSSDEIAYGDDKSGKDDVEELKLFDIDDDK